MKTILVDAINTFALSDKTIFVDMHKLLEEFPNSAWTEVAQQRIRQLSTETDGN